MEHSSYQSFNKNVDSLVTKSSSRIFQLRKSKTVKIGLDGIGLKTVYSIIIRSILSYAAPAWNFILGEHKSDTLEEIPRATLEVIIPDKDYVQRLAHLQNPSTM